MPRAAQLGRGADERVALLRVEPVKRDDDALARIQALGDRRREDGGGARVELGVRDAAGISLRTACGERTTPFSSKTRSVKRSRRSSDGETMTTRLPGE